MLTAEDRDGDKAPTTSITCSSCGTRCTPAHPKPGSGSWRASDRVRERIVDATTSSPSAGSKLTRRRRAHRELRHRLYPREKDEGIQAAKTAEYMGLGALTVSYDYAVTEEPGRPAPALATDARGFVDAVAHLIQDAAARECSAAAAAGQQRSWTSSQNATRSKSSTATSGSCASRRSSRTRTAAASSGAVSPPMAAAGATEVIVVDDGSTDASLAEAEAARDGGAVRRTRLRAGGQHRRSPCRRRRLILNSDCFSRRTQLRDDRAPPPTHASRSRRQRSSRPTARPASRIPRRDAMASIRTALSLMPADPRHTGEGIENVDVPLACASSGARRGRAGRARRALLLLLRTTTSVAVPRGRLRVVVA